MTMKHHPTKTRLPSLAALAVFTLCALCILLVLLTGANAYRRLVDRDHAAFDRRTAAQYITTRVRQANRAGDIRVEDFGGAEGLVLQEQLDGILCLTRVYCHDGYLKELFTAGEGNFSPEDGTKLLPAEELSFRLEEGLLTVHVLFSDGTEQTLLLQLRSGKEGTS